MTRRRPLPSSLGPNFSVARALAVGITDDRLDAHDLRMPFRGARTSSRLEPAPLDETVVAGFERRHRALVAHALSYVPVAPVDFRFSHVTAARLYRMPLPPHLMAHTDLDVAVSVGRQYPRRQGIAGHRVPAALESRVVNGLPVLAPEEVWLQLAPLLSTDQLVVAGDYLVRRKRRLSSMQQLAAAAERASGRHGIARARTAIRDIRPGTDSPKESEVRLSIVRAGLPEPVVGYKVHDDDGFFIGTPDLAYVREKIAIEYQGKHHQDDDRTYEDDIIRRQLFTAAGWHIILVTKAHSAQYTVSRVREALAQRPVDSLGHGTPSRR